MLSPGRIEMASREFWQAYQHSKQQSRVHPGNFDVVLEVMKV
jgi:hypothetical protein